MKESVIEKTELDKDWRDLKEGGCHETAGDRVLW